jgi:hypothetical protein
MISTANNRPWSLEPSIVCNTFPEDPINRYITGDYNWKVELDCTLNEVQKGDACVVSILPSYIALDIHKENFFFTISYEDDSTEYDILPIDIFNGQRVNISIEHSPKQNLIVFINNNEMVKFNLTSKGIKSGTNPCVVIGSNTFLADHLSKPSDLTLHGFKIYVEGELKSDHDFIQIIFNKSYDKTGNLNFLHTYNEGQ